MDSQHFIKYELVETVSNRREFTDSREEALAYLEEGWLVFEHRITITVPSPFVSTREDITVAWNDNPYWEE